MSGSLLKNSDFHVAQPSKSPVKAQPVVAKAVSQVLQATSVSTVAPTALDDFVQGLQIPKSQKELVKSRLKTYLIPSINDQPSAPKGVQPINLFTALQHADPLVTLEKRYQRAATALGLGELAPAQQNAVRIAHELYSDTEALLLTQGQLAEKLCVLQADNAFTSQQAKTLIYQMICGVMNRRAFRTHLAAAVVGGGAWRRLSRWPVPETPSTPEGSEKIPAMDMRQVFDRLSEVNGENAVETETLRDRIAYDINMVDRFKFQKLADILWLSDASLSLSSPFKAQFGYTGKDMRSRNVEGKYTVGQTEPIKIHIDKVNGSKLLSLEVLQGELERQNDIRDGLDEKTKTSYTDGWRDYAKRYLQNYLIPAMVYQSNNTEALAQETVMAIATYNLYLLQMTAPEADIEMTVDVDFTFPDKVEGSYKDDMRAVTMQGIEDASINEWQPGDVKTIRVNVLWKAGEEKPQISIADQSDEPMKQ